MKLTLLKKIWKDPVGSKVISAGIIFLIAQFFIFVWSLIREQNFYESYSDIFSFLRDILTNEIWLIYLVLSITFIVLIFFFRKIYLTENNYFGQKNEQELSPNIETEIRVAPTVFFHERFCDAFPGIQNEYQWFNSKKDINIRLKTLLKSPIEFDKSSGYGVEKRPIWWFRGSSAMYLKNFEVLTKNKVLLNWDELIIEKIAAYKGKSYYEDFVYVQCLPDKPTGLYDINQEYLNECVKKGRDYKEEFGIFKKKIISRQEFDDGATIIKGIPTPTHGAKLRSRTLVKYNFIIAAKYSPYNCQEFNRESKEYFSGLLNNEIEFEQFVEWMKIFPKNRNDD